MSGEARVPKWPESLPDVVARLEARIRARLDAMGPEAEAEFWGRMPWPFYPGACRERGDIGACPACGGWLRRGLLCGDCLGLVAVALARQAKKGLGNFL